MIDGRAVLYTSSPYRVIELDEGQSLWWLLLDGTPLDRTVDEVVAETGAPRAEVVVAAGEIRARNKSVVFCQEDAVVPVLDRRVLLVSCGGALLGTSVWAYEALHVAALALLALELGRLGSQCVHLACSLRR